MRGCVAAGIVLGMLAACPAGQGVMPPEEPRGTGFNGPLPVVTVFPESLPGERIRSADTGAVLLARWKGVVPGDHERVELVGPNGRVYERFNVPIGPAGEAQVRLALGGTFVEEFNLHGKWTARFFYNNGEAPVRELTFDVEP